MPHFYIVTYGIPTKELDPGWVGSFAPRSLAILFQWHKYGDNMPYVETAFTPGVLHKVLYETNPQNRIFCYSEEEANKKITEARESINEGCLIALYKCNLSPDIDRAYMRPINGDFMVLSPKEFNLIEVKLINKDGSIRESINFKPEDKLCYKY